MIIFKNSIRRSLIQKYPCFYFGSLLKEPADPANIKTMSVKIGDYAE